MNSVSAERIPTHVEVNVVGRRIALQMTGWRVALAGRRHNRPGV